MPCTVIDPMNDTICGSPAVAMIEGVVSRDGISLPGRVVRLGYCSEHEHLVPPTVRAGFSIVRTGVDGS